MKKLNLTQSSNNIYNLIYIHIYNAAHPLLYNMYPSKMYNDLFFPLNPHFILVVIKPWKLDKGQPLLLPFSVNETNQGITL